MELTIQIELPLRAVSNRRTRRAAAAFELDGLAAGGRGESLRVLGPTRLTISPGELVFLVGPSGSGKSLLLRAMEAAWPGPVVTGSLADGGATRWRPRAAVLDQLAGDLVGLEPVIRVLCAAGLAEPRLWLMPVSCLSAGQADRLALARLYARAEALAGGAIPVAADTARGRRTSALPLGPRPGRRLAGRATGSRSTGNPKSPIRSREVLLLIDEFGSRLDRLTAGILSANLRRWVDRQGTVAVVVASANDDLAGPLQPDQVWVKTMDGELRKGEGNRERR